MPAIVLRNERHDLVLAAVLTMFLACLVVGSGLASPARPALADALQQWASTTGQGIGSRLSPIRSIWGFPSAAR